MPTTAKNMQWLGDVALVACGSIEALFELAQANGMSITDTLSTGATLNTPEVVDARVYNWYRINSIEPATELPYESRKSGIGYWAIGINFIVS